jgi:hypothetical protein
MIKQAAAIQEGTEYVPLPDRFDLHEWQVMEDFCLARADEARRDDLRDLIRGRGAFSRFKRALSDRELEEWYQFRSDHYAAVAVHWLDSHQITYCDDREDPPKTQQ